MFIRIIVTIFLMLCCTQASEAKVGFSEQSFKDQQDIRQAHQNRLREYEEIKAQQKLDRELKKKRSALWKKEQARLTQEFRQRRTARLVELEEEKDKEKLVENYQK